MDDDPPSSRPPMYCSPAPPCSRRRRVADVGSDAAGAKSAVKGWAAICQKYCGTYMTGSIHADADCVMTGAAS